MRELPSSSPAVVVYTAVESTDKPVKIGVEILQAQPTRTLLEASRSAAMACVGARNQGSRRPTGLCPAARNRLFCVDLRSTERIVSSRVDRTYGEGFTW